ncbi:tRNA lysidine(34) synthetase TilS [Mycoplasma capricolum subsp. capripneumoniae]|uniref:tRNA(Ile)-lysidine synthase n=1 Tax=Mycoplasma capricolum subsp. capripneumoniae 87001 TaxID=1124992 RepID=A0A9N7G842_MYCCC|nr:tRNA lysidine(34) synthetase TilS [Mycoplasma capricolum]AJK51022.1 tRNA(Ile)-lysidine synthetase [Mycoplasma capricolum subsp. capripneumoniae 87001]AOQ21791.1 tRNA lysidine(34) synthetase TilS [Mycoplasma capricolum subsp. capripneumoniae M1601]KEY84476.1 tRNA(Ile)-lysidine synthase [Mycoplasma capricolum subsp. capripneumoniae 99108]QDL19281.1 tRNA lysidine(34) synthetase TilS [Mycoplasma capricolum subsp. capripneumoniae]QDL19967.1 tRNA lysidine(34) synthetase TilS [Mycoplasma capricolu
MNLFNIDTSKKYLLAISGGPDSIFLLCNIVKIIDPKNLVVCHVNYNFRSDSINDQKIVINLCKKFDLKLEILNINKDYSLLKENFESWARFQRYDFFNKIAKKYQIYNLLVAHNFNDLIETYLLQLQRNNLVDYYGLKTVSHYKELVVYRLLLDIKKSEILDYLQTNQISYAIDSTNTDIKYQRNKIRSIIDESIFIDIKNQIDIDNKKLETIKKIVNNYLEHNLTNKELILNKELFLLESNIIKRIIYKYFKLINKEKLLINRSNKTISEVAKRLVESNKSFWKINLNDHSLIKDYKKLFVIKNSLLEAKTIIISNLDDLANQTSFKDIKEIEQIIVREKNFSYVISNDYELYKSITTIRNKKTNRYFIDRKISYKTRFLAPVVYNIKDKIILNKVKKHY